MRFVLVLLFSLLSNYYNAKIVLPEIFSDYMVLQQKSVIKIWGKAKPRNTIAINASWSTKEYTTQTQKDGSWFILLETPNASFTEQVICINENKNQTTIQHVLIGEVWFCSGQSNMEMDFRGYKNQPIEDAEKVISEADPNCGVRLLKVKHNEQVKPENFGQGKWMNSTQENLPYFSAVAYFFGLKLRKELNVPIGLINSSWGGSSIEGWMSRELVEKYDDFNWKQKVPKDQSWKKACIMYNGMVKPYFDYVIKGILWYQGESNVGRQATYASKLKEMVQLWRNEWKLGELPFYLVEIAPYQYSDSIVGAKFREAQFKAAKSITKSYFVSTCDLVDELEENIIHPKRKQPIGKRLANLALKHTYFYDTICADFTVYESYKIVNDKILLKFKDQLGTPINSETSGQNSERLIGFEVAGEDQVFLPATARILSNNNFNLNQTDNESYEIEVFSTKITHPVAVRYRFKSFALGNVVNNCNLPLLPFRTDNWENH